MLPVQYGVQAQAIEKQHSHDSEQHSAELVQTRSQLATENEQLKREKEQLKLARQYSQVSAPSCVLGRSSRRTALLYPGATSFYRDTLFPRSWWPKCFTTPKTAGLVAPRAVTTQPLHRSFMCRCRKLRRRMGGVASLTGR